MPDVPSRSRRVLASLLTLSLALLAGMACQDAEATKEPTAGGPDPLLSVAPADLPAFVRERYRLRPDRRLILAAATVDRIVTGKASSVTAEPQKDGRWRTVADGKELGLLSEFPTFEETTELLARRAGSPAAADLAAGPEAAKVTRAIGDVDALALVAALASPDLDRRSVAAGLAWLATFTVDPLDQADALLAEAWARVAIDRDPRNEALVARALGYEAAGGRAGAQLAADDPVRLFAAGDEPGLGALCAKRPADRPCHFLHLALLAERDRPKVFPVALAKSPFRGDPSNFAILGLQTRLSTHDGGAAGLQLAESALGSLGLPPSGPQGPIGRTAEFETAIDRLAGSATGSIDVTAAQGWHRAVFYAGLFESVLFTVKQRVSGPEARDLASLMTPAAGSGDELRRWLEVQAGVLDRSRDLRPVAELLTSARAIGAAPLFELAAILSGKTGSTDPIRRQPIPAFFERMDTRPRHLVMASRVARRNLNSPGLVEKFARAAAEAAPHLSEELPALAALMREDTERLGAIAADPAMPQYAQVVALAGLADLGQTNDAFVRARYEALAADPDGSTVWLVDFLEKKKDLAGAVAVLDQAFAKAGDALTAAYLSSEKSRLQLLLGQVEKAAATIELAIDTNKEDALLQGAMVSLARRQPLRALELAEIAREHYPDGASEAAGLAARARWQLGQDAAAARELASDPGGILGPWNRYLPEAFTDAFATAPEEAARRAYAELVKAGLPYPVLARTALAVGKKRGHAFALSLLEGLTPSAPEWGEQIRLATYDLILEQEGPDEALAWVRRTIPERSHNFALTLYQARRYELLLGLFAEGEESQKPRVVRLVKAASHLHLGETSGPRWDVFLASLAADPADEFFGRATRILVDPGDGVALLAGIADSDRASIGWIMGVKAATARRFVDADAWFQVSLESARQDQPPHAWSWGIESEWIHTQRSLELLAKRGEFRPVPEKLPP